MKSNRRKLGLTKETITKLNNRLLSEVNGGVPSYVHSTRPPCSVFTMVTCYTNCSNCRDCMV